MTKKQRYYWVRGLEKLKDRRTGDDFYSCDIASLVNTLHEENKELKEFKQKVFDLIDGKVYRFIDCPMVLLELKKELNDD